VRSRGGEFVRGLGADEVLDYKVTDLKERVGAEEGWRFDVVLDCAGGKTLEDAWTCVKDGGWWSVLRSHRKRRSQLKISGRM